jgi:hypothetical protein
MRLASAGLKPALASSSPSRPTTIAALALRTGWGGWANGTVYAFDALATRRCTLIRFDTRAGRERFGRLEARLEPMPAGAAVFQHSVGTGQLAAAVRTVQAPRAGLATIDPGPVARRIRRHTG